MRHIEEAVVTFEGGEWEEWERMGEWENGGEDGEETRVWEARNRRSVSEQRRRQRTLADQPLGMTRDYNTCRAMFTTARDL